MAGFIFLMFILALFGLPWWTALAIIGLIALGCLLSEIYTTYYQPKPAAEDVD